MWMLFVSGRAYAGRKRRPTGELLMTAPHARQPQVLPRPACTPTAIRAVLAANADSDILQRYDEDLDAAYEQAREQGDVTPLVQTVKRWWFEADAWRDPQAQREFLARIDSYRDIGPPPADQRMSRDEIRTQFGVYPPDDLVLVVKIQWLGG
jgi:hypothetical protein